MKKNAALLTLIPVLFLSTYPLVYRSSTLSDLTKGSVAGLYIGLALVALFTSKSDQKGADR